MQIMTNYAGIPVRQNILSQNRASFKNVSKNMQPAFKSRQEVVVEGLYKKYSEQARKVLETIKQDSTVMDFINKYAKRVSVSAKKSAYNSTESRVRIKYAHPYEGFMEKFKNVLTGKSDNVIDISGFGTDVYQATNELCKNCGTERGCLNGHVKMHLEKINALKEKSEIEIASNNQKLADKSAMKSEQQRSNDTLRKTMSDFFEK